MCFFPFQVRDLSVRAPPNPFPPTGPSPAWMRVSPARPPPSRAPPSVRWRHWSTETPTWSRERRCKLHKCQTEAAGQDLKSLSSVREAEIRRDKEAELSQQRDRGRDQKRRERYARKRLLPGAQSIPLYNKIPNCWVFPMSRAQWLWRRQGRENFRALQGQNLKPALRVQAPRGIQE